MQSNGVKKMVLFMSQRHEKQLAGLFVPLVILAIKCLVSMESNAAKEMDVSKECQVIWQTCLYNIW